MGEPEFDESGRYVGRSERDEEPQTLRGQLREDLVRWLVVWGLLLGLFLCCLGFFWLGRD